MLCSKGRLVWCVTCLTVTLIIGGAVGPVAAGGGPEPGWAVAPGGFNGYPKITGNITVETAKMRPAGGTLALVNFTGKCENGAPVTVKGVFTTTGVFPPEGELEGTLGGQVIDSNPDPGLLSRCGVTAASGAVVGLAVQRVKVIPFPDTGDTIQSYYGAANLAVCQHNTNRRPIGLRAKALASCADEDLEPEPLDPFGLQRSPPQRRWGMGSRKKGDPREILP